MKYLVSLFFSLFVFTLNAQINLTPDKWRSDLRFLQHTVHNDYPFLFKKTTAQAFDAKVDSLHKLIPELQEHEIVVGFARIVSSFGYGHTSFGLLQDPVKFHRLPLNLYHFADGVFVNAVHKKYKNELGARVTHVEGLLVEQALKMVREVVPAENDQFFKAYGINYILVPEILHAQGVTTALKNTIRFTLEKNGKTYTRDFDALKSIKVAKRYGYVFEKGWKDARLPDATPLYLKNLDKIYFDEYLPKKKTVYIRHSAIQDESSEIIPAFYGRVFDFIDKNEVDRLIIDVRLNGGGNNYKNKPIVTNIIKSEKINKVGSLFVIIGRRTFSACQNLVNELSNYTNAIFVGEPTGENINFYGDNNRVELPNSKIAAYLSFAWWQDKPQWEGGEWTAPHVWVEPSFEDYRTNKDPALEAALNFSDKNFILNPMEHMTQLFTTGQMEQLAADAQRMVSDPNYGFFDFEKELSRAGNRLLIGGRYHEAESVFQFIIRLLPNSAVGWLGLGEVNTKLEQPEKAVGNFKKVMALDSEGLAGKQAEKLLRELQR